MSGFAKNNGSASSSSKFGTGIRGGFGAAGGGGILGARGRGVYAGICCDICPRRGCGDDTGLTPIFGGEL